MTPNQLTIVYIGDERIVKPLSVSVFTLLSFLPENQKVDLHILQKGWSKKNFRFLEHSLTKFSSQLRVYYHEVDLEPYANLPSFHGSKHCYSLLHVTQYVRSSRFLYIDYDTLPLIDISELYFSDLGIYSCGAVSWNMTADMSQEREFFNDVGLDADTTVFNSGVVLIDRDKWESKKITEKCMKIVNSHGDKVLGDQTILNAALKGNFHQLPWKFNVRLGATARKFDGQGIAHFVGSPKPWSALGRWKHKNYQLWKTWEQASSLGKTSTIL